MTQVKFNQSFEEWKHRLGSAFLAIMGLSGLFVANQFLHEDYRVQLSRRPPLTERDAPWNSNLLRALSFGFTPVTVDFLLLQFLGDDRIQHLSPDQKHAESFYVLDLATRLDPLFFQLYLAGAGILTAVRDDNAGAYQLNQRGIETLEGKVSSENETFKELYWPHPWRLYLNQVYLSLYEAQDVELAKAALDRAVLYKDSPDYFKSLRERLETEEGRYEVSFRTLDHMISLQRTPEAKAPFLKRQQDLKLNYWLWKLNESAPTRKAKEAKVGIQDPLGGKIYINSEGLLDSTSERSKNPWVNKEFIYQRKR